MIETESDIEVLFPRPDGPLLDRHLGLLEAAAFYLRFRSAFEHRLQVELELLERNLRRARERDELVGVVSGVQYGLRLLVNVVEELHVGVREGDLDVAGCEGMLYDAQALLFDLVDEVN